MTPYGHSRGLKIVGHSSVNTQLNEFYIEFRRTIKDTDNIMVPANLVDNVICRYFCLNNLLHVVPFNT